MISLSVVLMPRASYLLKEGKTEQFWKIARKSLNFSALFAIPMMVYFVLFAETAVLFIAGPMYMPAVEAMTVIMACLVLIGFSYPLGIQILVPLNKEKVVLYSEIAGAVINIIANIILIKMYGVAGAAAGTLIAEAVVLLVQYASIKRDNIKLFSDIQWSKIIAAIAVGALPAYMIKRFALGSFAELALSSICFFGCYGLVLLIAREPMTCELFKTLMAKLKRIMRK